MAALSSQFLNASVDNIVASISLGQPKVNSVGGKSIDINHAVTKKPVMIRLAKTKCWGIKKQDFDGKSKYSLGLAFPLKPTPESDAMIANFRELDEFVKTQAISNSKDWFNKPKMSMEVVEALYSPCLRYSKTETGEPNMTKPPGFTIKIPFWNDGRCDSEVYNFDNTLLFPNGDTLIEDTVSNGSFITALIQCGGIWFAGGKFGITFKLKQACVQPSDYLPRGVNLCGDARSTIPKHEEIVRPREEAPRPEAAEVSLAVADSDEERDPEAEYSTPDDAAPVKGKKKVVKKA
jgi:hypothetical protein